MKASEEGWILYGMKMEANSCCRSAIEISNEQVDR